MEQPTRDKQAIQHLYNTILPALAEQIHQSILPILPLFDSFGLERVIDTWTKDPASDADEVISVEKGNVQQLGLKLRLEGFQKPGVETFDLTKDVLFKLEYSSYTVGPDKNTSWLEKPYLQRWDTQEYKDIASRWSEELIDDLTQRLEKLT
ncbi:hypothetical protein [Pontibacter chinhatensis]|uniref:Uncharacterized protein n=1 Tax=Pontibacter chinhatensis TaxID=1436961 RepID=A0A1I2Y6T3_9BACT|nr:hypothetical protein [Pontibacter chinhatensis]SFH21322.1 hypothetical protein SAMN05421739_10799 [Pontibacter chinhatensis]